MDPFPQVGDILMGTIYSDNYVLKVKLDTYNIIACLIDKYTYPLSVYKKFIMKMAGRHINVKVVKTDKEKGNVDVSCKLC
ncbi:interferon resistance protein [Yokapox virus]|uniref:Interferon resistance protein n=1 Tax=Yokapox virus TaxID=1076255 RepID=G3EI94_9POXV|nr:interferon resistance protein [Yokapox virus]AEN03605.1 interferon resistance protein [Yokapox virus]